MDKFRNKYHIPSTRLQNWDYGWNAAYFITICTAKKECFFGDIIDRKMKLSEIGELANNHLLEIPQRYEYAILDAFIVMPNHVHAIIIIDKSNDERGGIGNCKNTNDGDAISRDAINRVSTGLPGPPDSGINTHSDTGFSPKSGTDKNPPKRGGITGDKNPMLHDNISRILNWYTGRVTYESHKIDKNYQWQAGFHDHIIRNNAEYQRIKNYIIDNPQNWKGDKFYND